jgi:hypothetical protein
MQTMRSMIRVAMSPVSLYSESFVVSDFAMPNFYALQDLSHDPKLADALGNMVIAWAHAEIVLFSALSRITGIGLNMSMAGYHRIPTFEARVKFILALIPEWKTDRFDKDAITKAIEKLSHLSAARNQWIHGDWCADKAKTLTVIFNHRVSLDSSERRKPVKEADVRNHCEAVKGRAKALSDLIDFASLKA